MSLNLSFYYFFDHVRQNVDYFSFKSHLLAYIAHFSYKSLTSNDWKDFLYSHFADQTEKLDSVDWDTWFYKPGLAPCGKGNYDTTLQEKCTELASKWTGKLDDVDGFANSDITEFSSSQLQEFLDQLHLAEPMSQIAVAAMDKSYPIISKSKNSEIRFRWIRVGLKARYVPAIDEALAMVTEQGRMKFTRPLYRDLNEWDDARAKAVMTFKKNRSSMHNTTATMVANDLKIAPTKF